MRQARLLGLKTIEIRDVAAPALNPGEIRVKIRAALTCGTDLKTYRRGHPKLGFGPFGHEASGDVSAVAADVSKFSVGDAVMWVQSAPCAACPACLSGRDNLCEKLLEGMALGAYADELVLPKKVVERNVFPKPANLSYVEAAFLEPLACVVHGWHRLARLGSPRDVAIVGAGTIGMLHLQYAVRAGIPATVIARRPDRRTLATRLGARDFWLADDLGRRRSSQDDRSTAPPADRTGPFEAVIECAGNPESWTLAVSLARPGGAVLLFGGLPGGSQPDVDATRLHYDELALLGTFHFTPDDVVEAREFLCSGLLDAQSLISAIEPLSALPQVFERLDNSQGYKYAIVPDSALPEWV